MVVVTNSIQEGSTQMMEPFFGPAPTMWGAVPTPRGTPIASPTPIRLSPEALGYAAPPLALAGSVGLAGFPAFTEVVAPSAAAVVAAVAMRRGQAAAPATDAEIEDFLNDALDLVPGTVDVEVRCEGGRATLTGSVPNKRHKHDVGEIAWAIPTINDVQNNVNIVARRRARASTREGEPQQQAGPVRKHA
jgi:hypothetical protein